MRAIPQKRSKRLTPSHSQDKTKTFKPKRKISKNTKRYELHKAAKNTLGSGNLKLAVKLPEREDLNEWLAVNSTFPLLHPP